MTPQRAAKILASHNEWRRGFTSEMVNGKDLTEAIEVAVAELTGKRRPVTVTRFNPLPDHPEKD